MKYALFSVVGVLGAVVVYFAVIGVACMYLTYPASYDDSKCQVMYGKV